MRRQKQRQRQRQRQRQSHEGRVEFVAVAASLVSTVASVNQSRSPSLHSLTRSGHRLCPPCASTPPVRLNSPRPSRVAGRTHLLYLWRTLSRSRLTGDLQGRFVTLGLTLVRCSDRNAVCRHLARRSSVARCGRPCTAEWRIT